MIYHGRYRVVRRAPADLRLVDGVWTLYRDGKAVAWFDEWFDGETVERLTGVEPEEAARGGWRCFWQETPRRNALERR